MPINVNLFNGLIAGKNPAKIALILEDDSTISYGSLAGQSAQLAHRLIALGVAPGDRIAVQVEKSATALLLYLASLRTGAVYLPLNTGYTLTELSYFLDNAEPKILIVDPVSEADAAPLARQVGATLLTLAANGRGSLTEGLDVYPSAFEDVPRKAVDLAAILYTSGTTGLSKGAMLTHGNLLSNAATLVDVWQFTASDELLHALPIYHTHGLFVATNVALLSGASIRLLAKFDPDAVFAGLRTATTMMGVPTFYTRMLADERLDRETTAGIRLFISGSAPLLAETHRAWQATTGHMILERYGMTETNMNTSNPYEGERRPGTVGPALPGVSVRVVDEFTGALVDAGAVGMIEVRGPNVFQGYWRMPEKTAEEFRADGFFITGDLGRMSEDGYVEIVGRGKDLVITGGLNVYPKEVETEIDSLDGIEESAVIGLPHADYGEAVTAVVIRKAGATVSDAEIVAALALRLARFKLPKAVIFADVLPRNTMGKVQKKLLRDRFASYFVA